MVPSYVRFGETFDDTRQLDGFPRVSVDVGKGLLKVRQFSWLNGRHRQPAPNIRDYSRYCIIEMIILCFKKGFHGSFVRIETQSLPVQVSSSPREGCKQSGSQKVKVFDSLVFTWC